MAAENENYAELLKVIGAIVRKVKILHPEYVVDLIFLFLKLRTGCELGKSCFVPSGLANPVLNVGKFVEDSLDVLLADMSESMIVKSTQLAQARAVVSAEEEAALEKQTRDDAVVAASAAVASGASAIVPADTGGKKKKAKPKKKADPQALDAIGDSCSTKTTFLQLLNNTMEYMSGKIDTESRFSELITSYKFVALCGSMTESVELVVRGSTKPIRSLLTVTRTTFGKRSW